jgi:hypothetical protein
VYAGGVSFESALVERFGGLARRDVRLSDFTTFRVGGPADWLLELRATGDLVDAVRLARRPTWRARCWAVAPTW